jgi:hypothetical protein
MAMERSESPTLAERLGWFAYLTVVNGGVPPVTELFAPRVMRELDAESDRYSLAATPLREAETSSRDREGAAA